MNIPKSFAEKLIAISNNETVSIGLFKSKQSKDLLDIFFSENILQKSKKIEELAKIEPLIKDISEKLGKSKQIYNDLKVKQTKQVEQKQIEQKAEINKIKNHFKTLESNSLKSIFTPKND